MTFENIWSVCDGFVRDLIFASTQHFNRWFVEAIWPVSVDSKPVQLLVISVQIGHISSVIDLLVNEHMFFVWWDILVDFIVGEQKVFLFSREFNFQLDVDRFLRPLLQREFKLPILLLNSFESIFLLLFDDFTPLNLPKLLQSFHLELLNVNAVQFLLLLVDSTLRLQFLIFDLWLYSCGCNLGGGSVRLCLLLFSTNHLLAFN